jgi:hypothetical protein
MPANVTSVCRGTRVLAIGKVGTMIRDGPDVYCEFPAYITHLFIFHFTSYSHVVSTRVYTPDPTRHYPIQQAARAPQHQAQPTSSRE